MKNRVICFIFFCSIVWTGCTDNKANKTSAPKQETTSMPPRDSVQKSEPATAQEIMNRKQVPILCYHHIREISMPTKALNGYEVTIGQFKEQMKALADSGYTSILPDQLYDYLVYGKSLPEKPVMITFDDTSEEHFTIAKKELEKNGFKGVFYIMTISIGRPRYMTSEQIKQLSDDGHVIGSHTWDHNRVDRYKYENTIEMRGQKRVVNDWDVQLADTKTRLEEITGKPVHYFAYPFGIWSPEGIPEIRKRGYKMAFQLSTARDSNEPLYTVRRMIVSPQWTAAGMLRTMRTTFK